MAKALTTEQGLIPDARLRELAGKGWFLHFLEQYPAVRGLRAGANPAWLLGLDEPAPAAGGSPR